MNFDKCPVLHLQSMKLDKESLNVEIIGSRLFIHYHFTGLVYFFLIMPKDFLYASILPHFKIIEMYNPINWNVWMKESTI